MHGLFITGTDTGVGKTYVTCLLARQLVRLGYSVGVYKPACSGAEEDGTRWPDLEQLSRAVHQQFPLDWICPQRFAAPMAPPVAAAVQGKSVDADLLRSGVDVWRDQVDVLLVEGVGGWLCPLTETETVADLARDLGFPALMVAANRLGMINQTLLTVQSMIFSGVPLCGAVVNPVSSEDDGTHGSNLQMLKKFTDVPLFGPLPWFTEQEADAPVQQIDEIISHLVQAKWLPARI